jgi:hypothetical protein
MQPTSRTRLGSDRTYGTDRSGARCPGASPSPSTRLGLLRAILGLNRPGSATIVFSLRELDGRLACRVGEASRFASSHAPLKNIKNGEEKDPDDVDEMPVKTGALKKAVLGRRNVTSQGFNQRSDKEANTDENVQTVKTG